MTMTQRITPCIWLDGQAEAAAKLYTALFPDSHIDQISRYGKEGFDRHGQPEGKVLMVAMTLAGTPLNALNGGPHFKLNPSISFFVQLETEPEVEALWAGLGEGGNILMPLDAYPWSRRYGWLSDRFGLSWQIALGPRAAVGQAIAPFLLFCGDQHGRAEAAMEFYTSTFPGSSVTGILRHDGSNGSIAGTVQHGQFQLSGQTFMVTESAHPHAFAFNEALSFVVTCKDQGEVDHYWTALTSKGGTESMCGWLKDRHGVSWQIVPDALPRLLSSTDRAAAGRAMNAMLTMRKLDIAALEAEVKVN